MNEMTASPSHLIEAELKDAVFVVSGLKERTAKFEGEMRDIKMWRMKTAGEKALRLREKLALALTSPRKPAFLQADGATYERVLMRHCSAVIDNVNGVSDGGEAAAEQRARIAAHIKGSDVWKSFEDKARAQGMQADIKVEYTCIADFGTSGQDFGTQISLVLKAGEDIRPQLQAQSRAEQRNDVHKQAASLGMRPIERG